MKGKTWFRGAAGLLTFAAFATPALGQKASTVRYDGPIIDFHAHLRLGDRDRAGPNHDVGTQTLERLGREAGVSESALIVMARKGQMALTRSQNDAVIAAAAGGRRFFPIGSVHPLDGAEALAELERVQKLGVKVIKLHPNSQNFDVSDPAVAGLAARAGELGLILLFDSYKPWDASGMGKLALLAISNPKARLVLAHMGLTHFREVQSYVMLKRLGLANNVWFELSAIAPLYADSPVETELVWTMRAVGMERFLFGSDWPAFMPAEAVNAVRRLGLSKEEQRQVFHDNACLLLGRRLQPEVVKGGKKKQGEKAAADGSRVKCIAEAPAAPQPER